MGTKITITNSRISGNTSFGNRNSGSWGLDDTQILIDNVFMDKNLSFLEDNDFVNAVDQAIEKLSDDKESDEYKSLKRISERGRLTIDIIKGHLMSFTSGTLASILANMITR